MQKNTYDPLIFAARLAAEQGIRLCPHCVAESTDQAGRLDRPDYPSADLTPEQVAVCDLLLREYDLADVQVILGEWTLAHAILRLRMTARIASLMLPAVVHDYEGRFVLAPDEGGYLPEVPDLVSALRRLVSRLGDYVGDHDQGEWVDPYAVAGAVADVHDATRMLDALLDLAGDPREKHCTCC